MSTILVSHVLESSRSLSSKQIQCITYHELGAYFVMSTFTFSSYGTPQVWLGLDIDRGLASARLGNSRAEMT